MFTVPKPVRLAFLFVLVGVWITSQAFIFYNTYETQKFAHEQRIALQNRNIEERCFGAIKDAEAGQSGYLLTQSKRSLVQYTVAVSQVRTYVRTLKTYLTANSAQIKTFSAMSHVMDLKLDELQKTIALAQAGKVDEARAVFAAEEGTNYTDQIADYMATLRAQESNDSRQKAR